MQKKMFSVLFYLKKKLNQFGHYDSVANVTQSASAPNSSLGRRAENQRSSDQWSALIIPNDSALGHLIQRASRLMAPNEAEAN